MTVLSGGKSSDIALCIARQYHRYLIIQYEHLLQHTCLTTKTEECGLRLFKIGNPGLTLAVVAKAGDFQNTRIEWIAGCGYVLRILDNDIECNRQASVTQEVFFQHTILCNSHGFCIGTYCGCLRKIR